MSGTTRPSQANEMEFNAAVRDIAAIARTLIDSMVTTAQPKSREEEAAKARARAAERFGR